jgi:hypothetical protein
LIAALADGLFCNLFGGAASAFRLHEMVPLVVVFQIRNMHIKCLIGDLYFDGEAEHHQHHQHDRAEKQPTANRSGVQLCGDHRR